MTGQEFKALDALNKIRTLSGIIMLTGDDKKDANRMITLLTLCNLIVRVELGDADMEFLNETIDRYFPPVTSAEELMDEVKKLADNKEESDENPS